MNENIVQNHLNIALLNVLLFFFRPGTNTITKQTKFHKA